MPPSTVPPSALPPKREINSKRGKERSRSLTRDSDEPKKRRCGHWLPADEASYPQSATWFTPAVLPPTEKQITFRALCTTLIRGRIPDFRPRNSFDLIATGFSDIRGSPEEVQAWVDGLYDSVLAGEFFGKKEGLHHLVEAKLDAYADVTGLKPSPNADDVVTTPIQGTSYSLRIWPGSRLHSEYCVDFVETDTTIPVNTPEGFEIWLRFPHYMNFDPTKIAPLDRSLHANTAEVMEGAEKYVLRDGQKCILKQGGVDVLRFSIPKRPKLDSLRRCAAGICPAQAESIGFEALDVDTSLYYSMTESEDSE